MLSTAPFAVQESFTPFPPNQMWDLFPVLELGIGLDALAIRLNRNVAEHEDDLDRFGVIEYEISGVRAAFRAYRPHREQACCLWLDGFAVDRTGQDGRVLGHALLEHLKLQDLPLTWATDYAVPPHVVAYRVQHGDFKQT
jgi:hypothetical protein